MNIGVMQSNDNMRKVSNLSAFHLGNQLRCFFRIVSLVHAKVKTWSACSTHFRNWHFKLCIYGSYGHIPYMAIIALSFEFCACFGP